MQAKAALLTAASAVAVVAAYGPLLVEFGVGLWSKPHYQHFPFVLLAAFLLAASRLREEAVGWEPPGWLRHVVYVIAWAVLAMAYWAFSPLLACISLILLVGGWLISLSRQLDSDYPLGPWLLLWLLIPPPLGLDGQLMQSLQKLSSLLSSYVLDIAHINHLMDGNALVLPDKQLFVDEACSGIISVISILACAALYGVWRRRSGLHTLLTMLLAMGWAALLNVVRISTIAMAWEWFGVDWSEGTSHTVLGLVIFALSLLTLVATDWFLNAALAEIEPRWELQSGEPLHYGARVVAWWDAFIAGFDDQQEGAVRHMGWGPLGARAAAISLGILPTIAFAGLGATQLVAIGGSESREVLKINRDAFTEALQNGLVPESVAGLKLVSTEFENRSASSRFGEYSVRYRYDGPTGKAYIVSCDFAFGGGWHELSVCYEGIGWRVEDRKIVRLEGQPSFDCAVLDLTKPDGRDALVSFTACYADGTPIDAPTLTFAERLAQSFRGNRRRAVFDQSFQTQVIVESTSGVTAEDRVTSTRLLAAMQERIIDVASAVNRLENP